ncbi:putative glycolipid permease LtaA [compost metagenome]
MGIVYMAWLSGVGLGPVVINFFIKGNDYGLSFRLLIGCMIAVVLVAWLLPKRPQMLNANSKGARVDELEHKPTLSSDAPKAATTGKWTQRVAVYMSELKRSMSVSPLLFPAMFAQTFALGILTPILTLYAREVLHLTSFQYSMFLIAGGVVTVAFLIPVGKLVDRYGIRWFLVVGFSISAAALLGFTYVQSMPVLYVFVAALGVGYAFIIPSWNALIASAIPPDKRGAVWGFFLTIEGMGMIVGPIVSGKLWDVYGFHVPFLTSGCVLVVLLILQAFISIDKKVVIR